MEKDGFYNETSQFEPLMPSELRHLEDLGYELTKHSAGLANELPQATLEGVKELLRIVNSYYSNLIEGNDTHPIEVERAMRKDYSHDPAKRDRQTESIVHIDVQTKIDDRLSVEPKLDVTNARFLSWIHHEFYKQIPESLRWITDENGNREWVEAGEFRSRMVAVGNHVPPTPESIPAFLRRFNEFYFPDTIHGTKKFVAIAAAHHRFAWIHPFLDGNGRVARLFADAYFRRIELTGYGLWNVSRGLALRNSDYKKFLAAADFHREGDLDGRGNLSDRTLTDFCNFFLEVCVDQAQYMASVLKLNEFLPRLDSYVKKRAEKQVVDVKGVIAEPLHPKAGRILREAAILGELGRGTVFEIIEMSDRTARNVLSSLLSEGLLIASSDWHRSNVRLGFPPHAAGYWFPNLFPPA